MSEFIALYNPFSDCGNGEKTAHRLDDMSLSGNIRYVDITSVKDYPSFFDSLSEDEALILCGGDGTINRFVNDTYSIPYKNQIYYFACGTGNDFLRDIEHQQDEKPVNITEYLKDLPIVKVKGREYRFLNNVGFGIDGYCTQVGDEMRKAGKEKINYAGIAIKGILGKFHPVNAAVTVDGKTQGYSKLWLAPTMKGRFYGGGMMAAPDQDRKSEDGTVSLMVYHTGSKLKALIAFPSIFKGEHIKRKKMIHIFKGHNIHVKFDRPCALQIDGETILDVTEYEVHTGRQGKVQNKTIKEEAAVC